MTEGRGPKVTTTGDDHAALLYPSSVRRALAAMAVLGLVSVACGEDYRAGASRERGFEQECQKYAESICKRYAACVPGLLQLLYGGPVSCAEVTATQCKIAFTAPGAIADASTIGRCGEAMLAQDCESRVADRTPEECLIAGTRAVGESCFGDEQCASKGCRNVGADFCGTCVEISREGEPCEGDTCARGTFCVEGTCQPNTQLGEKCSASHPCAYGLRCDFGTCARFLEEGDACTQDVECNVVAGFVCADGRCRAATFVEPGQSCDGEDLVCKAGRCVQQGSTRVCVANPSYGEPCNASTPCFAGLVCLAGQCVYPDQTICK